MRPIPTIAQLYADIVADLDTSFQGQPITPFGRVWLRALAGVQAAKLKLYYLAQADLQKNIFVDTAYTEAQGGTMERFGRVKLNRNPFPPRAGQYTVTVTGTAAAVIPLNATFKSDDSSAAPGFLFILDNAYTMPGTTGTITLRCLTAGIEARIATGNTLTATAPIAGVDSTATVTATVIEAAAAETLEQYRAVVLDSYRTEPQGGAGADYRIWAADAQGVQRVYPYATSGSTFEIDLFVEATTADSTDGKGTPSAQLLLDVEDVVELDPDSTRPLDERWRRPLQVIVNYLPITPLDIIVTVYNYQGLTAAIQAAIEASVADTVNAMRPFVSSADLVANRNDVLSVNKIISAIYQANSGSIFNTVELYVNGALTPSYTFTNGNIPYFVTINFV